MRLVVSDARLEAIDQRLCALVSRINPSVYLGIEYKDYKGLSDNYPRIYRIYPGGDSHLMDLKKIFGGGGHPSMLCCKGDECDLAVGSEGPKNRSYTILKCVSSPHSISDFLNGLEPGRDNPVSVSADGTISIKDGRSIQFVYSP